MTLLKLPDSVVRPPARPFTGPQPATVLRVTAGQLYVELDEVDGLEVGPCAWAKPLAAHSHSDPDGTTGSYTPPDPVAGTRCLVLFAGEGVSDPWVVAFDRWPA